ncbi:MAG: TIGR01244 family sulfur transferase [Pseudomonadota bacterium]
MDIRVLTDEFSAAPQLAPEDMTEVAQLGYKTVICNRPDDEAPLDACQAQMRSAVEEAGMTFLCNPFVSGQMTLEHVEAQREMVKTAEGPVLAYCASGTRTTICWAFAMAPEMASEDIVSAAAKGGYQLAGLAPQLDAMRDG